MVSVAIAAALGVSLCYSTWNAPKSGFPAAIICVSLALFVALVYWGIYWLNQFVVRKNLEPRREELESLLAGLDK